MRRIDIKKMQKTNIRKFSFDWNCFCNLVDFMFEHCWCLYNDWYTILFSKRSQISNMADKIALHWGVIAWFVALLVSYVASISGNIIYIFELALHR